MENKQNPKIDPLVAMSFNERFRSLNMYENIEPLPDEVKVFQCEQSDETSSIRSDISAMSLRSTTNSFCNEKLSSNDEIHQRLKRIQQMAESRKEIKDNEQQIIPNRIEHNDDDDEEEYDEEKGAQLLQKMIASVLKPKSKQKEAFIENMNFKPDIITSTTDKKSRFQRYDKSDKNGRI